MEPDAMENQDAISAVSDSLEELPNLRHEIRTENLVKEYNRKLVVNCVSISVKQGEVVGLLGPNGAGKTTTFHMIVGLIRPNSGKIFLDGKNIEKLPMYKRARLGIGYLSQESSIFRKMTVRDNLMAILETLPLSPKERKDRLLELLEELKVSHLMNQMAYTLSGGERRRVEIARALVIRPTFMLLDEPFAGVDPIAVEDIQSIIHQLRQKNLGVLITDHNVRETLAITDHANIIAEGKILTAGNSEFLARDEDARRIYLGQNFRLD
jgi:lipopolysaccharide export system ATP-binding protein